jgi:neuraminyllactose-binding hemagglutinin
VNAYFRVHFGLFVLLLIATIGLSGCATRTEIPVKTERGVINYAQPQIKQEAATKYAIAIVGGNFDKITYSYPSYAGELSSALAKAFLDILNKKGFSIKGPYPTMYDMTYLDKQQSYLAMTPQIDSFIITETIADIVNHEYYASQKSTYAISGEIFIKIFEPITGEALINKRINFSNLKVSKRFFKEWQTNYSGGASSIAYLTDNSQKAVADLFNDFFVKAVNKIADDISREELLTLEKRVMELKSRKRY